MPEVTVMGSGEARAVFKQTFKMSNSPLPTPLLHLQKNSKKKGNSIWTQKMFSTSFDRPYISLCVCVCV